MKSFRVYFVTHVGGRLSGTLMRRWELFFEPPPPSAYGRDEEEVLAQLETEALAIEAQGVDEISRYLWDERFELRSVGVEVNPHSVVKNTGVIGKRIIPLRVFFAWTKLASGARLVMLPRFGWRFIVEEIELAPTVIKQTIAASLSGEEPKWIYDFRTDGPEYVRGWSPSRMSLDERATNTSDRYVPEELSQIADELVGLAARKRLPLRVGVDATLLDAVSLFEMETLPSLLIVGERGVGKSTFVRALAEHLLAISRGKRGPRRHHRLWSTSATRIVAGMAYLGMWQQRCLRITEELSFEGDYLYLDRLIDVLAPQSDGANIFELLFPAIEAKEISVIVECDETELAVARRRFPSIVDKLHVIRIEALRGPALFELLGIYAERRLGEGAMTTTALRRVVTLLGAFRPDQCFPGKAIRFFDWLAGRTGAARVHTPRDAAEQFSRYSGLPLELISDEVPAGGDVIAARLARRVIGQDAACRTAARALARFKAGLNDPERPVATLFFVGPTGVGKTELAKQLARYMFGDDKRLVRVDMSELMTPGSSQRLLDTSPGAESLATRVRAEPLTVVLLDEVEKAHPEVFDLLLGVLGEGRMTDAHGRLVDFRMTVIIMTSNLGNKRARRLGFGSDAGAPSSRRGAVSQHFRPEFVARIDEVVSFRALSLTDITRIVDIVVGQVRRRIGLTQRGIELTMSDDARLHLAELGFDPKMGARPLKRVVEDHVVAPLAERLAADPGFSPPSVRLTLQDGRLTWV